MGRRHSGRPSVDLETAHAESQGPPLRAAVVVGWMLIALGTTTYFGGAYSPREIALVAAGTLLIGWAVVPRRRLLFGDMAVRLALVAAAGLALVTSIQHPAGLYGHGSALVISHQFTTVAAAVLLLLAVLALRTPDHSRMFGFGYLILPIMVAAGVCLIISSPAPAIDVWYMYQSAAHSIAHGHNIYTTSWTSGNPYESSNIFTYLPGSAVLLTPFHAVFGDVRYGLLATLVITCVMLMLGTKRSRLGPVAPCLVALYPKTLFGIEQSWIDPMVLCTVAVTAYLVTRRRFGWAVVSFAVCLTIKQTAWVLLPLAALWRPFGWKRAGIAAMGALAVITPWALAEPRAFYEGMKYNVTTISGRIDALSLNAVALRHGVHLSPFTTVVCVGGAILLSVFCLPRTTGGFLIGCAFTISIFNITYKLAFFNEWCLAAGFAMAGFAFWHTGTFPECSLPARSLGDATRVPTDEVHSPMTRLNSLRMVLLKAGRVKV